MCELMAFGNREAILSDKGFLLDSKQAIANNIKS
jgi:hypothetical protein